HQDSTATRASRSGPLCAPTIRSRLLPKKKALPSPPFSAGWGKFTSLELERPARYWTRYELAAQASADTCRRCVLLQGGAVIRATVPADTTSLVALAEATAVFKPAEIVALQEVLDDYHAANQELGHLCVTDEENGQIRGFAYYAPASMTDRTWYLWWIAVNK